MVLSVAIERGLLFPTDTLEGFAVSFLIHETAGVAVALHEALVLRIEHLGAIANCAIPVPVAFWWVSSHIGFSVVVRN